MLLNTLRNNKNYFQLLFFISFHFLKNKVLTWAFSSGVPHFTKITISSSSGMIAFHFLKVLVAEYELAWTSCTSMFKHSLSKYFS